VWPRYWPLLASAGDGSGGLGQRAMVKVLFLKYEGVDETLRAAAMSELSYEMRQQALPRRLELMEEALQPVEDRFNETDWIRLRNSVFILTTTAIVRAFKDYLNLSVEEAADTVAWIIRTLTSSSSQREAEEREQESGDLL